MKVDIRYVGRSTCTRYWQQYAFANLPEGYEARRVAEMPFDRMGVTNKFLLYTKMFLTIPGVDMYHMYNGIVMNQRPWIVEVESRIPRYGTFDSQSKQYQFGMRLLRSRYCKKIIFTSQCTAQMNRERLLAEGIEPEKLTTLYRAFEVFEPIERPDDGRIRILFVGNAFYRKGGIELVEAFQRIRRDDVELKIVSTFERDWHTRPTQNEIDDVRKRIEKDPRITVIGNLSHEAVIQEMRRSDIFTCPTFADSFNNSILEAMGCGLPVVVTTLRAIPEFVEHERNGFLLTHNGSNRRAFVDEIEARLLQLIENPAMRTAFGKESTAITREDFSIENRNCKLKKIYDEALG